MLIGQYSHSMDARGRTSLPVKFKKEIGKKFYIAKALDGCISVYTEKGFKKLVDNLANLSESKASDRAISRHFMSGAMEIEADSLGRIMIPEYLRVSANLSKKIVWAGRADHAEIWNEATWNSYLKENLRNPEKIAESLDVSI